MATTVSYGKCGQCNENNAMSTQACRRCGAPLPWAKSAVPKKSAQVAQQASGVSAEPLIFWLLGILIFVVSFVFPFFGYRLHKYLAEETEGLAKFAAFGGLIGVGLWLIGLAAVMAKVGQMPPK
jgi:hypothetical protein